MKVLVASDDQGTIIAMGKPQEIGDKPSGITGIGIIPGTGQQVHFVDLPAELENKPFHEVYASEFRLDLKGERARLVRVRDFIVPFTEKK